MTSANIGNTAINATTVHTRKAQRAMGASRDFTTGTPTGATAVLDHQEDTRRRRPRRASAGATAASAPPRPERTEPRPETGPAPAPTRPRRRLGSRQVVSVRGRRVAPLKKASLLPRLSAVAIVLLIGGVAVAMWLSGLATQQTFRLQSLVAQDSQLSNELETLNRDLENVSSSAEIARRANEMGMVVPQQPGILSAENPETIEELRPAGPGATELLDVNGAPVRPGQASSDPRETDELGENLQAVPQGESLPPAPQRAAPQPQADVPGVAPYSAGGNPAPAPAPQPAPAPALAPVPASPDPEQAGESGQ